MSSTTTTTLVELTVPAEKTLKKIEKILSACGKGIGWYLCQPGTGQNFCYFSLLWCLGELDHLLRGHTPLRPRCPVDISIGQGFRGIVK